MEDVISCLGVVQRALYRRRFSDGETAVFDFEEQ